MFPQRHIKQEALEAKMEEDTEGKVVQCKEMKYAWIEVSLFRVITENALL